MACKCIEKTNEALKEHNAELDTSFKFNFKTGKAPIVLPVALRKRSPSRKPLPTLMATFCPFCGKRVLKKTPYKRLPRLATKL